MSEEQTIISAAPEALAAERTQVVVPPGADVTQAAIAIQCPVCQTSNPPGDRWCQDCGFLLSSAVPEALELPAAGGPRLSLDGREFELRAGANSIGRANADVLLLDSTVSRHHATLTITDEGVWIEDVGSTNGTFLNGAPLPAGERRPLQDGATLKFGSVTVKLVWSEGSVAPASSDRAAEQGSGAGAAPAEAPVALLVAADGRVEEIRPGVTTLGRRGENRIVVSGDPYVSGRHAEIRCDSGGCVLVDVGSTNGTFLRSASSGEWERLPSHDPRPLTPGIELRLGQSEFTFQAAPADPPAEPGAAEGEDPAVGEEGEATAPPAGALDEDTNAAVPDA